jgi:hypothetical protein
MSRHTMSHHTEGGERNPEILQSQEFQSQQKKEKVRAMAKGAAR